MSRKTRKHGRFYISRGHDHLLGNFIQIMEPAKKDEELIFDWDEFLGLTIAPKDLRKQLEPEDTFTDIEDKVIAWVRKENKKT